MRKLLLYIIMPISIILLMGRATCAETYYYLNFKNTSSNDVYIGISYTKPDTLIPSKILSLKESKPNKIIAFFDNDLGDDQLGQFDKLGAMVFFINKEIYESTPWDTIRKYNMILKRIELTREDYNNKWNRVVTYP